MAMEGCPGSNVFSSEASALRSRSRASSNCPRSWSTVARFDWLRGDGGVSGLERLLIGGQRLAQQIARFLQLPQSLEHHRQIRLTDGDGGVSGLERLFIGGQRLAQQIARFLQLPQILEHRARFD